MHLLPLLVSVSVAEALRELTQVDVRLRWPNDLFVSGRKLGGVLCEGGFKGSVPDVFVIGIGVNVHQARTDLPPDLRDRATSLDVVGLSTTDVAVAVVARLEQWWEDGERAPVIARYRELAEGLGGERVRVEPREARSFTGVTAGITEDGGLIVDSDDGATQVLFAETLTRLHPEAQPGLCGSDGSDEHGEPEETHDNYYGAIESYFIERRGSPLFITPAEWFVIAGWEEDGIPLRAVKDGIDRALERPRRGSRPPKLTYCRQSVRAEFRRSREIQLGGREDTRPAETAPDTATHLSELAARLEGSHPAVAKGVEALARSKHSPSAVETALEALDEEMIAATEATLDPDLRARLEAAAARSLESYREKMPDQVYQKAVTSAYRKRLRAAMGLPLLSLYDR